MRYALCVVVAAILAVSGWTSAAAEQRLALVVGNSAYLHTSPLKNPRNDAADVAAALKRLGFEVVEGYDLDKRAMDQLFLQFARRAGEADTALVYFAGHGATFGNVPYLVPIDAKFEDEASIPYELARLDDVLSELRRAKGVRIAIVDACRDSEAEQALKRRIARTRGTSQTRGLTLPNERTGLLIAYATQPSTVALDTAGGRNSPFTEALLKHIEQPGVDVRLMFTRVKSDVYEKTRQGQLPELSDSLIGEFQLKPGAPASLAALPPPAPPDPIPVAPAPNPELQAWRRVETTSDIAALQGFLDQFKGGTFTDAAKDRMAVLKAAHMRTRLASAQGFQLTACRGGLGGSLSPNWNWHYPAETPTVANGNRALVCKNGKQGLLYTRESETFTFFVTDTRWRKATDFHDNACGAVDQYCSR